MSDTPPRPDFIAAQLRKPSGDFANTIAQNMDKSNEPLYDLTLQSMDLQGQQQVLEIGFGSGRFIHKLFARDPQVKLTGLDYSPEMVELARTVNSELVRSGSLKLEEGSSDHMPFEAGTFDIVYSNMVIYFWDDPARHLREVGRVLKSGGTFHTGFRTAQSMQGPFAQFGFTFYEPDEWQALLEKHGFKALGTSRQMDPAMVVPTGQRIQLESVCVVAQKQP